MNNNHITFINNLNSKLSDFEIRKSDAVPVNRKFNLKKYVNIIYSIVDFALLLLKVNTFKKNKTRIFFTHTSFVKNVNGKNLDVLYDDLVNPKDSIFISYDKFNYLKSVNDIKVYNIGAIVRVLAVIGVKKPQSKLQNFERWKYIVEQFTRRLCNNYVFIPAYSNETGLSLIFNKYRKNFILAEVQHGSVINYPPYSFVSEIYLVEEFFYRDEESKSFLLKNLFAIHTPRMTPLKINKVKLAKQTSKTEILYISSYEFNGFHPVFEDYLNSKPLNVHIKVRLHPRQTHLEPLFILVLKSSNVLFEIDKSTFWYDNIPENTVVISPLSSVIEEAVNIGLKTIIIDPLGAKRFSYLLERDNCKYSDNLCTLNLIK